MHARRSIFLAGSRWCNRLPLSPKIGEKGVRRGRH